VHIKDKTSNLEIGGQELACFDSLDVVTQRVALIGRGQKIPTPGVDTSDRSYPSADLFVRCADHGTVCVLHHADARNAKQVRGQNQRAKSVIGSPCASITDDFGVPGLQPKHCQRINSGVDARQYGETFRRFPFYARIVEHTPVALVSLQQIIEHLNVLPLEHVPPADLGGGPGKILDATMCSEESYDVETRNEGCPTASMTRATSFYYHGKMG